LGEAVESGRQVARKRVSASGKEELMKKVTGYAAVHLSAELDLVDRI